MDLQTSRCQSKICSSTLTRQKVCETPEHVERRALEARERVRHEKGEAQEGEAHVLENRE